MIFMLTYNGFLLFESAILNNFLNAFILISNIILIDITHTYKQKFFELFGNF